MAGRRAAAAPPEPIDPVSGDLGPRVRQLRQQRGWSLEDLATLSGVSRSMLSQIERSQANPTLAVTCKIAQAFGLSLGELVESPTAASSMHVIRRDDPAHLYRSDANAEIRTLSPLHLEKDVEFYQVRLPVGGALKSAPHFEGTREFLTVQQGRLRLICAGDAVELARGDSSSYRADVPHALENTGPSEAIVFLVVIYR